MRIPNQSVTDNSLVPTPSSESSNRVGQAQAHASTSVGSPLAVTGGDQATLGASAVNLTATALQQPDVRSELVSRLRAQIAGGTYTVNASKVAEAMLSDPLTGLGN